MARWNLRAAADAADRARLANAESRRWRDLAERIVDGYDPATGRYEQFAGYFGLEPLLVTDFAAPPVGADLLLGRERVAGSQVIKQPDVLMLHHLVPEEVAVGSLAPNLDYYGPRTCLGRRVRLDITRERVEIGTDGPLLAGLAGAMPRSYRDGRLSGLDAIGRISWAGWVTLAFQVMPVFFLLGGYVHADSPTGALRH